ncbi:MAG: Smr/MutS family protein [Spirochaetales bacterium]|nr:Smr/MutS family protein [Spirochaetales bacterium]
MLKNLFDNTYNGKVMKEIDLHELKVKEAIEKFVSFYNSNFSQKEKEEIRVVHGYGASGVGGTICVELRKFLEAHSEYLVFIEGERLLKNPGVTFVKPRKRLPDIQSRLEMEILEYCSVARSMEKIHNKFRKEGAELVKKALKSLKNSNYVEVFSKNGHQCYVKL